MPHRNNEVIQVFGLFLIVDCNYFMKVQNETPIFQQNASEDGFAFPPLQLSIIECWSSRDSEFCDSSDDDATHCG